MKTKNLTAAILAILLISLSAKASAEDTAVDKPVKYGDKYICEITTTDEKNYTLDIDWQTEPDKFSKTPKWQDKLIYNLKQNNETIDGGYFSDLGFRGGKVEFVFDSDKFIFSAVKFQPTRTGDYTYSVDIELAKNYDQNAKLALSVTKFSSGSEKSYYRLWEPEELKLIIKSSACNMQ